MICLDCGEEIEGAKEGDLEVCEKCLLKRLKRPREQIEAVKEFERGYEEG